MAGLGSLGGDWNIFGLHLPGFLSFIFFWGIHLLVLRHGMESIKKFEVWAGPLVYLVFGGMVWWAIDIAGGLGPIYSQPGKFHTFSETFWPFAAGVTGIIGIWATLILNIPDFTRFAASQKEQIRGQFYGSAGNVCAVRVCKHHGDIRITGSIRRTDLGCGGDFGPV